MSYVVTLEYPYDSTDHLKAVADDGVHGRMNCAFPKEVFGISRYDFRNHGVKFEVSALGYKPGDKNYRVSKKDVIRIIPSGTSTTSAPTVSTPAPAVTPVTSAPVQVKEEPVAEIPIATEPEREIRVNKNKFRKVNIQPGALGLEEDYGEADYPMDMIHKAHFKDARDPYDPEPDPEKRRRVPDVLKTEAMIILRLYEATILRLFDKDNPDMDAKAIRLVPSKPYTCRVTGKSSDDIYHFKPEDDNTPYGIKRKDLLKMCGIANYDADAEQQSALDDMLYAGLGYVNPANDPDARNVIFPGGNLEKFVMGKLDFADKAMEIVDVKVKDPVTGKMVTKREEDPITGKLKKVRELIPYQFHDTSMVPEVGKIKNINVFKDACAAKTTLPGRDPLFDFLPSIFTLDPKKNILPQIREQQKKAKAAATTPATTTEPTVATEPTTSTEPVITAPQEVQPVPTAAPVVKRINKNKFRKVQREEPSEENQEMKVAESLIDEDYTYSIKEEYCNEYHLDPKSRLGLNDYDDYGFRYLCCRHNIPVEEFRARIFGDIKL